MKLLSASIYKGSTAKKSSARRRKAKVDYTRYQEAIEEKTPQAEETDDFHSCQEGMKQVAPLSTSKHFATKLPQQQTIQFGPSSRKTMVSRA